MPRVTPIARLLTDPSDFWSQASALGPACVFAPSRSQDLGTAVKVLRKFNAPFAVRGGGHTPIGTFNNINSTGVLLSSTGFQRLQLSKDSKSVHIGPGNHWNSVYDYLEPYGLTVVGGRLGVVGVPGFVTGGGLSFMSNQHGWASANVASFTVVLADGHVVKATSNNAYSDLYWALRGGGNSFGIVTDLELLTYSAPVVTIGQATYNTTKDLFLSSVYNFAINSTAIAEPKSAVLPVANYAKNSSIHYSTMRFYDGNNTSPPALSNFTSPYQPPLTDTFSSRSMAAWTRESDVQFEAVMGKVRTRFYILSLFPDLKAMHTVHDAWFSAIPAALSSIPSYNTGVAFMPISEQFFRASRARGGDPMDIDPAAGPQIWVELSLIWSGGPETEDVVTRFLKDMDGVFKKNLRAAGARENKYLYLNDADAWQDVWAGYSPKNVERLKSIRAKYDAQSVFTDLMPGGWKVRDA